MFFVSFGNKYNKLLIEFIDQTFRLPHEAIDNGMVHGSRFVGIGKGEDGMSEAPDTIRQMGTLLLPGTLEQVG